MRPNSFNIALIFLLAFLFATEVQSATQYVATATCVPCTTPCSTGGCFKVVGSGLTREVCSSVNCSSNALNHKVGVSLCTSDVYGNKCSSGLCFAEKNRTAACHPGVTSCPSTLNFFQKCSTNCSNTSCQTCIKSVKLEGSTQQCVVQPCSTYIDRQATVFACPFSRDEQGNACTCCAATKLSTHSLCLNVASGNTEQLAFLKNYLSNTTNTTNGNWEIMAGVNAYLWAMAVILIAIYGMEYGY